MSMNAQLRRIPAADAERARRDSEFRSLLTMGNFGAGFDPAAMLSELPWYLRIALRLLNRGQFAAAKSGPDTPPVPGQLLDLHKSWHGIHWLLCQHPWEGPLPLKHTLFGQEEIGEDLGYGPARLNAPSEVLEVEKALRALSDAELMRRYDPKKMDELEIYPGNFTEDSSWRSDLKRDYNRLRKFYQEAAQEGDAVLTWLD